MPTASGAIRAPRNSDEASHAEPKLRATHARRRPETATLLALGPSSVAELRLLANATPGTAQHAQMRHQARCAVLADDGAFSDDDDDDDGGGGEGGGAAADDDDEDEEDDDDAAAGAAPTAASPAHSDVSGGADGFCLVEPPSPGREGGGSGTTAVSPGGGAGSLLSSL